MSKYVRRISDGSLQVVIVLFAAAMSSTAQDTQSWPPHDTRDKILQACGAYHHTTSLDEAAKDFGFSVEAAEPLLREILQDLGRTRIRMREINAVESNLAYRRLAAWLADTHSSQGLELALQIIEDDDYPENIRKSLLSDLGKWNAPSVGEVYLRILRRDWKGEETRSMSDLTQVLVGVRSSLKNYPMRNRAISQDLMNSIQRIREECSVLHERFPDNDSFKYGGMRLDSTWQEIEEYCDRNREEDSEQSEDEQGNAPSVPGDQGEEGRASATPQSDQSKTDAESEGGTFPVVGVIAAVAGALIVLLILKALFKR